MATDRAKTERPRAGPLGATDPSRWRLDSSQDRHVWHYDRPQDSRSSAVYEAVWGPRPTEQLAAEQNDETKYWLELDVPAPQPPLEQPRGNPYKAAQNGFEFYKRIQASDGHWSGEVRVVPSLAVSSLADLRIDSTCPYGAGRLQYGGPLFLLPGIVIAMYVTKTPIPEEWKIEIARYLSNVQRTNGPGDEGWGIHIEAQSSVFGTGLNYVTLRLLGVDAEEPMMIRARATLHHLGGCTGIPSWGKFWLAILNVHSWSGLNPTPTELWLLPELLPIHPYRWWIHTRNVYIPMGYLNGRYFQADLDPLILSLRQEIYVEPYESIKWSSCRNNVCPIDLYAPHSAVANGLFAILNVYDRFAPAFIRNRGLARAYELIKMEDDNTSYQSVGPVSKAMHMICRWLEEGPDSDAFKAHLSCIRDFMWVSSQGMLMSGTNGSQLWDTSFIGQALVESNLALEPSNKKSLEKMLDWLDHSQIRENPPHFEKAYRHRTMGAWPFSTKEQGYTVSDCTAEGLKTVIMLQGLPGVKERVSKRRLCDAIDTILTMQNADGGFASYELIRGPHWLEWLNPAEVFGNIMTEYSYPECTTACVTALTIFKRKHPDYRADDIDRVSKRAIEYIHKKQRPDGSWYGSWAICFTYAGMFAIESLSLAGEHFDNSESVKRACEFLLSKQMEDGGWGESYKSCETEQYVQHAQSQVTQTAWAVIGLITAQYPDTKPIRRGCRLIMSRQLPSGEWPQEAIEGVFNKNAAISYPNYKFAWTINALGQAWKYLGKEGW